ncbi:MAG: glycosyltransferase family 39 protein [Stellaceae bacterium]
MLALVLGLHLLLWTLIPILVCPNLQLDLVEDLALGKEWQLGYWKHPPLPWWAADLLYRLTGQIDAVYVLGPLAAVICLYAVWLLARETLGAFEGLIAVLALEGVHFYNFSVVKFAHDQMQLPFWAFTGLFFYRALKRGQALDWILAGALLAGAFWSKYAAFALAATLGLFLLADPEARRAWRTSGPYLMAIAFAVGIALNVWWLMGHDFMPFQYVDARARVAMHWYQYIAYPLQWIGSQAWFLLPAAGLLTLLYLGANVGKREVSDGAAFDRRCVTWLALGPFLVTTLVGALLGRLVIAMWGYPLWSFAPLALVMWFKPVAEMRALRRFAAAFIAVFVAIPVIYAAIEIGEPFVRDRPKATQFPGRALAEIVTREWHDRYRTPLAYVGGSEFEVNNVAVYSQDRPHVVVHGELKLSPWVDIGELRRRGAVLVWEDGLAGSNIDQLRATFGDIEVQPVLVLARQTWHPVRPDRVAYAFVPPRP